MVIFEHMQTVMYPKAKANSSFPRWFICSWSLLSVGSLRMEIDIITARVIPRQTKVIEFDALFAALNASHAEYLDEYTILK